MKICLCFCLILIIPFVCDAAKKKKKTPAEKSAQPQEKTVIERELVTENVKASKILKEFKSYSNTKNDVKNFDGVTLAYITPWHYDGFELAKTFKKKLDLVSPAWLSVRPLPDGQAMIVGLHLKRPDWMKAMRKDTNVKIVPRLVFEDWHPEDFERIFGTEENINKFTDHLIRVCKENAFDGYVVEMWNALFFKRGKELLHVITHMGEKLLAAKLFFVLVIPPPFGRGVRPVVIQEELEELYDFVDYFAIMTYDYGTPDKPGCVAPLLWIKECIHFFSHERNGPAENNEILRKKFLLGINFYGLKMVEGESRGETIMNGEVYTNLLDKYMPKFTWQEREGEHLGKYETEDKKKMELWYPTLYSIQKRLDLAKSLGIAGVAIWEIGQGLDYFFDLL